MDASEMGVQFWKEIDKERIRKEEEKEYVYVYNSKSWKNVSHSLIQNDYIYIFHYTSYAEIALKNDWFYSWKTDIKTIKDHGIYVFSFCT